MSRPLALAQLLVDADLTVGVDGYQAAIVSTPNAVQIRFDRLSALVVFWRRIRQFTASMPIVSALQKVVYSTSTNCEICLRHRVIMTLRPGSPASNYRFRRTLHFLNIILASIESLWRRRS